MQTLGFALSVVTRRDLSPSIALRRKFLAADLTVSSLCARSAQAVVLLQKAGIPRIANLAGGMLRWVAEHHPVTSAPT